ncbi:MAG: DUF6445 family protein [Pseudomonadota bacterium]
MTQEYTIERMGEEAEPLVIIDDFSPDPDRLFAVATERAYARKGPHYPGVRAGADPAYLGARMEVLQDVLTHVFGLAAGADLVECAFSVVTTPPGALTPIQRIPHFDSTDPKRLALLHYLCDGSAGGTAFYRHRATGFEKITAARHGPYTAALQGEAADLPGAGYIAGTTTMFEEVGRVSAAWNRMAIYRGCRLHSGVIPDGLTLSEDPRKGRLTVNTFLQGR